MEATNRFRVRGVVPLAGRYADRTLMPEFPGIEKAERTQDWDAGFPLVHKIRDKDEAYWKQHRGTPKAFVSLAAGQKMWANRFGNLTAIRWEVPGDVPPQTFVNQIETSLPRRLRPADLGLRFEPVREQALRAANQAQDFGQLFLGFSFFLIVAALILMALLFQFGLEQRAAEVGTLLALGFTPQGVRRLFLWEGATLAALGGGFGAVGGLAYARAMLHGLTTLWRDAVGVSALGFHVTATTLVTGFLAGVVVGVLAIWLTLRKQAQRPARELLAGSSEFQGLVFASPASRRGVRLGWMALAGAIGLVGWAGTRGAAGSAGAFFGAGSLLLIAGLAFTAALLGRLAEAERNRRFTLAALGFRGCTRRRNRSLAVTGLLACGSFLIVAIGAFRLDADREAAARPAGTGGFALIGESSLPVMRDLNTPAGREFYGLDERELAGVSFVPMRVREGDEASCLNLNRAQKPRLLGVQSELLAQRGAFTFAEAARAPHLERADGGAETGRTPGPRSPWRLLQPGTRNPEPGTAEVRAIGDANSIQWALGKKVGDTLDYVDEQGRPFKVRLVGAVANSILQGSLLIDEAEFTRRFPGEGGYRFFLMDAPSNRVAEVSAALSRSFQDLGLELTPAPRRLAQFNAVQNTYLNTFQVLGALGLLLGSAGLGVVVLRNVLERRGELALLQAVGFRRRALHRLVLAEHAGLLWAGLGIGLVAALAAILPALLAPGAPVPSGSLAVTVGGVFLSGMLWTWLATRLALRGDLLQALRNE
jgi:ABC-type antimicrobial peptide transport system permease subunit